MALDISESCHCPDSGRQMVCHDYLQSELHRRVAYIRRTTVVLPWGFHLRTPGTRDPPNHGGRRPGNDKVIITAASRRAHGLLISRPEYNAHLLTWESE